MDEDGGIPGRPGRGGASVGELSVALFGLALVAFSPAMLAIFGVPRLVAGIPLLYLYLFAAWGLVIALLALLARRAGRAAGGEQAPPAPDGPAATRPEEG